MAKKDLLANTDDITTAVVREEGKTEKTTTFIRLPKLENLGGGGATVDQFEHVTIANERGLERFTVQRGITVEVPYQVFRQLYEKYGKEICV